MATRRRGYAAASVSVNHARRIRAHAFEVAQAYTLFLNGGSVRPLKAIDTDPGRRARRSTRSPALKQVARADTYLVTNMMRASSTKGRAPGRGPPASRTTRLARPARPTTCATPGSSASRRSCSRWSGSGTTTISRCR